MRPDSKRSADWTEVAQGGVSRLTVALREAQARGEVVMACEPEALAHFVVASLKGASLISKVTRDVSVMKHCVSELERYLALHEVRS